MNDNIVVYEVIRIINSKPLFVKDHYNRLLNTLNSYIKKPVLSYTTFIDNINETIKNNNILNGNIRLETGYSGSDIIKLSSQQVPHKYPTEKDYREGVKTITIKYERKNPQDKIWDSELRYKVDNIIKTEDVYEIIYVNNENNITEGSRSNIFFINDNYLYSAPFYQVLSGITRKYVIETAQTNDIKFVEALIYQDNISSFDAAFISGTSPKILPISYINNIKFNVKNVTLQKLISEFNKLIESNISNN